MKNRSRNINDQQNSREKRRHRSLPRILILAAGICLVLFGVYHIARNMQDYHEANTEYELLADKYTHSILAETASPGSASSAGSDPSAGGSGSSSRRMISVSAEALAEYQSNGLKIDWDGLEEINPDLVAWLYYEDDVNDIHISLPVVREPEDEPNKYLHTTFEGTANFTGCLFIAPDSSFEESLNTFIYGHNMRNGTMFGELKKFLNTPEKISSTSFWIYFPDSSAARYEILTACPTENGSSLYFIPATGDEYEKYLEDLKAAGSFVNDQADTKAAVKEESLLVTLSTCYGQAGGTHRLLITGIREDVVTPEVLEASKNS